MNLQEIRNLIEKGTESARALEELTVYLQAHPGDDEALTLRGKLYWAMGKRSEAIGDHLAAVKLNPESGSKHALRAIYDVLNFYNKDLYNP